MNEVAALTMRVQSMEVELAQNRLKGLKTSGKEAESATNSLTSSFKSLIAPLLATVSAVGALNKLVDTARQFDVLNAQLITATGSAENAGVAFEAIQEFAAKTPYDLAQAVEGFTQLVNLGLTPSEKALTSYGNTASAMGKDLSQMIGAVADATTGEFERLKEFGIKAKSEGDKVSFTFRGVTTTVGKNAAEIEGYLMALGENEFAGAMQQRAESLDGAISNLGDTWDQVFLNVSNSGIGDYMEEQVRSATAALEELNAMILSGELEGYLTALSMKFEGYNRDVQQSIEILRSWISTSEDMTGVVDGILGAFQNLPENVRFLIQAMVIEVMSGFEKIEVYSMDIVDRIKAIFTDDTQEQVAQRLAENIQRINQVREDSLQTIADERQASISSSEAQVEAAKKLREEYDKAQAAKEAAVTGDRLAGFYKGNRDEGKGTEDTKAAEKRKKEFDKVKESLRSEEQTILDSYNRRRKIILENTEANSQAQADLLKGLNEKFATDVMGDWNKPDNYEEEIALLQKQYEDKRAIVLENTALTEQERTDLEVKLTEERNEKLAALENQRMMNTLGNAAQIFDGLASISEQFSGKQSGTYKALFAISKAFSIAQATVSIATGIAKAQELGFPANLAAIASVISTTAGVMSTIRGAKMEGIAHGGLDYVPEESTYRLAKGERVLSPKQNKDFTDFMNRSEGSSGNVVKLNVEVVNRVSGNPTNATVEMINEDSIRIMIDAVDQHLAQDLNAGRGVWQQAEQKYTWNNRGMI